jgi:hypothetical protein
MKNKELIYAVVAIAVLFVVTKWLNKKYVQNEATASAIGRLRPGIAKFPPTMCHCLGTDGGVYQQYCSKGWCPTCCKEMRERESKG